MSHFRLFRKTQLVYEQPMVKLVTWNVNSVRMRLDRLLKLLVREKPDIVCLQELKCTEENFPFEVVERAGYTSAVFGQKTFNGVAILSRSKMLNIRKGLETTDDGSARFIVASCSGLKVASVYVPNGQAVGSEKYQFKLHWLALFRQLIERSESPLSPLILAGDFNITPDDRDVHDPDLWRGKILCSEPERKALNDILKFGLHDTFRKFTNEGGHFSWWDYRRLAFQKNHGLRIDLVLTTSPLYDRAISCTIDRAERKGQSPSDHAPVLVSLK